jgi:hypothetical protein
MGATLFCIDGRAAREAVQGKTPSRDNAGGAHPLRLAKRIWEHSAIGKNAPRLALAYRAPLGDVFSTLACLEYQSRITQDAGDTRQVTR